MADLSFDYPAILTNAAWQKNKGKIAKLVVGKTDVGAALTAIEAETKKYFDGIKPFLGTDPLDFANYVQQLQKDLSVGAKAIQTKVTNAGPIIKACIADFANSKLTPKSSTKYAMSVQAALKPFTNDVLAFSAKVTQGLVDDYKKKLSTMGAFLGIKGTAENAEKTYSKLMDSIKKVESTKTLKGFKAVFAGDGPHRQMTTACKQWDQHVPKFFPTLAAGIYGGKAMNEFAGLPHMMAVANEANGVASEIIQGKIDGGTAEDRAVTTFMLEYSRSCIGCKPILDHIKKVWAELKKYE